MSIVTKAILKGYFETGDRPTEAQFIDLIDSIAILGTNTGDITFVGTVTATTGSFGYLNLSGGADFDSINVGGGYGNTGLTVTNTGQLSTDDYILTETYISASTFISTPKIKSEGTDFIIIQDTIQVQGDVTASGFKGDGSGLTNIQADQEVHGNKVSVTGSINIASNINNTIATNNTGEFTIPVGADYTVDTGAQVDLQYTPIAERLYRYDVDTGNFIPYAQANIDSETTLMKGFGAGTAGVGNDITIRHNATVPENFVTTLYTTTHNVTQSEDPNNNPIVNDPHSITIQDQSTYTIKAGADVTIDGVHHGVVRKDIALFKTIGIGDTQAIGPSGSNSFNDQYNNIYPSASAHLHISASDPRLVVEAKSGAPEISLIGSSSKHAGYVSFKNGADHRLDPNWESEFRISYNANESTKPLQIIQFNKDNTKQHIVKIFSGSATNNLVITGSRVGIGTTDPQATLYVEGDISASGTITALSGSFSELSGNSPLTINGEIIFTGPITSSGNISSSGTITTSGATIKGHLVGKNSGLNDSHLTGFTNIQGYGNFQMGNSETIDSHIITGRSEFVGHITASGNISSSGILLGSSAVFASNGTIKSTVDSFGNISSSAAITASTLLIDGATIDFTGLPTSDPGVAGRLWNDSGDLKISS